MRWNNAAGIVVSAVLVTLGSGCSGDGGGGATVHLVPTSVTPGGNGQAGPAGATLPNPISVTVLDQNGDPMSGIAVALAVLTGNGTLGDSSLVTNAQGVASTTWTLGTASGTNNNTAKATVTGFTGSAPILTASANAGAAAVLVYSSGDQQMGVINTTTAPLVVRVLDSYGNPVPGVPVTWTVTSGGGSVSGSTVPTTTAGFSSVTRTLGSTMAGNGTLATAAGTTPATVSFLAISTAVGSNYFIDVQFLSAMTPSQAAAFTAAAARWSSIVVGDLPDVPMTFGPGGVCGDNVPAVNEVVDDLLIFATIAPIDGVGGILGQAGPCYIRNAGSLTVVGRMTFDVADVAVMETNGIFTSVILHEMGHVLGFGGLWPLPYMNPSLVTGAGGADPYFNGATAVAQFNLDGGALGYPGGTPVPVENTGGAGTRDAHWRESVMGRELMTGYISASALGNPLSSISIGSMEDMGYTVNYTTADPYTVSATLRAPGGAPDIQLVEPAWTQPIYRVDSQGRMTRVQ